MEASDLAVDVGVESIGNDAEPKPVDIGGLGESIGDKMAEIQQKLDKAKSADPQDKTGVVKIEGLPDLTIDQVARIMIYLGEMNENASKIRQQVELTEIKNNKRLMGLKTDFLLDACGTQPYTNTVKRGIVEITFQLVSADEFALVNQQCVRDMRVGRAMSTDENLFFLYKLAMSIREIKICPPGNATMRQHYVRDDVVDEDERKELKLDKYDLLPRALYRRLVGQIIKSSAMTRIVTGAFMEFEKDVEDLSLLATRDPDFFLDCSTEAT